jgi:hypothetical protein
VPHDDSAEADRSQVPFLVNVVERLAQELPVLMTDFEPLHADLAALLARLRAGDGDPEETLDEILALLASRQETRTRLDDLLGPEHAEDRTPRFAGDPVVGYEQAVCPRCGRAWVILDADEDELPPERCPNDGAVLTVIQGT